MVGPAPPFALGWLLLPRVGRPSFRTPNSSPCIQRYSVLRFGRHTWGAGFGPGLGSVLGSFTPVRHRSPMFTQIVFAQLADGGGRR